MKEIREQFGLTLQCMAHVLGITSTNYTMYEYGHRKLPLPARHKLNRILALVQAGDVPESSVAAPPLQGPSLKKATKLCRKVHEIGRELDRAEKTLENMQSKHRASKKMFDLIQVLKADPGTTRKEMHMISTSENEVMIKLQSMGPGEQALLEYQVSVLRHQYHATLALAAKIGAVQENQLILETTEKNKGKKT